MNQTHRFGPEFRGKAVCRVTYRMTDRMGVVYYGNYLELMEMGRGELLRSCGIDYREMEAEGYLFPATHVSIDYLAPARYDDLVAIATRIHTMTRVKVHFDYEMHLLDGAHPHAGTRILARGKSHHVFMGPDGRPRRLAPDWMARLEELAREYGTDELRERFGARSDSENPHPEKEPTP